MRLLLVGALLLGSVAQAAPIFDAADDGVGVARYSFFDVFLGGIALGGVADTTAPASTSFFDVFFYLGPGGGSLRSQPLENISFFDVFLDFRDKGGNSLGDMVSLSMTQGMVGGNSFFDVFFDVFVPPIDPEATLASLSTPVTESGVLTFMVSGEAGPARLVFDEESFVWVIDPPFIGPIFELEVAPGPLGPVIPEPATMLLVGTGAAALARLRRKAA
jgi:hypothetical protein